MRLIPAQGCCARLQLVWVDASTLYPAVHGPDDAAQEVMGASAAVWEDPCETPLHPWSPQNSAQKHAGCLEFRRLLE